MCYSPNDLPPNPPGSPGEASGADLTLTSADGTQFAAYFAHPSSLQPAPNSPCVILYPDVRGLHNFYKELALRFAEQGIHALAIDYFGRTAGLTSRDESFEYMPHVHQIEFPTALADVQAAIAYLQTHAAEASEQAPSIFTCGFCFGGSLSYATSTQSLPLAGAIAFYGSLSRQFTGTDAPVLDLTVNARVPVLGLFGGADQGIPETSVHQLDLNLDTAGVPHEIVVYPGAPHSFFDRKSAEFAKESADAWTRTLAFIEQYSAR
jgi:carboxymethylenebutenolidase